MGKTRAIGLAALCALWMTSACGGGAAGTAPPKTGDPDKDTVRDDPGRPVHARGRDEVTATLGPAGGSLELSSGPRIEIPAGALETGRELVLKEAPLTTVFANDEAEKAAGPTFLLSPHVGSAGGPMIKVSIPMAKLPAGFHEPTLHYEYEHHERVGGEDAVHTMWDIIPAEVRGGRMVAETEGLPGLRLQFTVTDESVQ